ncbi:M81 family metallopeptidase [Agrobacterium tumefaciens]|uniref:M81 family metallopeptidase n=1 Tax=Agrobacterium tumefaciens TaxID=358 RepID=UPI0021FBF0F9|nr:M81 family metallopeptidase [Agrobacterium tumefaciens]
MAKKRIAVLGLRHEAMLACPFLTDETTCVIWRGEEIRNAKLDVLSGVFDRIEREPDVEAVPLLFCRTLPGGPFTKELYEKIKFESLSLLSAHGPFHGLLVLNHGAAEVDGLDQHGDTDYVCAIRKLVGPDVPISIPFDHHAQITPELFAAIDAMACLRTAPHRDTYETSWRASEQLLSMVATGERPKKAAVNIPIYVPGEKCMTEYSPARELFSMLPDYDAMPGVGEAHIFVGFGWNDVPWGGMKAVVTHESSETEAVRLATEIAERIWSARDQFSLKMGTANVRDGLLRAATASDALIYLSDSGDNTTCGAGGDLTFVLQEAIELDMENIVVGGIFGPEIVESCRAAGKGASVTLEIGHHISGRSLPKTVTAIVLDLGDTLDVSAYPNLRGNDSPWVSVRIGQVIATFHAARVSFTGPGHFAAVNIDPKAFKIYVVKVGYLHPEQEDLASRHICLISEGLGALDFDLLEFKHIVRPAYPMDQRMNWSAQSAVW